MVEEISVVVAGGVEYFFEHVGDVVGADDAAVFPYLDDFGEVDAPSVLLVGLVDDLMLYFVRFLIANGHGTLCVLTLIPWTKAERNAS